MRMVLKINLILTILLSIATGIFKITGQKEDIDLFAKIGFTEKMTFTLGVLQLVGGLLLIYSKTKKIGAIIMAATFCIASYAVFMNGLIIFGFVSLVFILMTLLIIFNTSQNEKES